jgi:serine protease inhibitor ecotin
MNKVNLKLPEWDEKHQRPKTNMPICPQCKKADEFVMIEEDRCICYNCGLDLIKINHNWYLVEIPED